MKIRLKHLLTIAAGLLISHATFAGWGITGFYVFGDSLSDSGNAALWDEGFFGEGESFSYPTPPYYEGRASNGPVWIEIVADAYGYDVSPSLEGGRNFAFIGAETGVGMSDQGTPNFLEQVALFQAARDSREIKSVHPKDLFVVWVGSNDFHRILDEAGEIGEEDIALAVANIAEGIQILASEGARLFLVPNMPAVHLSPYFQELGTGEAISGLETAFNEALEATLQIIEQDKKITIYRLDTNRYLKDIHETPAMYGLENVDQPLILNLPEVPEEGDPITDFNFLFWDQFHPTVEGHALLAQLAMNVIPIGSWWGHSVARGPDGTAFLGMGWVDDTQWPWLYSYSLLDGTWMWIYDEAGSVEGFLSFLPEGYKWIWVNAMSGWIYDYSTGEWIQIVEPEEDPEEEIPDEG